MAVELKPRQGMEVPLKPKPLDALRYPQSFPDSKNVPVQAYSSLTTNCTWLGVKPQLLRCE